MVPAVIVGVALLGSFLVIGLIENSMIFAPPRFPEGFPGLEDFPHALEEVWITAEDGVKLNAFFLPAPASSQILLWFHGNAENIGMGVSQMVVFHELGVNLLEIDYRGYGKSEGKPDEAGVYRDADAAYRYLVETRRFDPKNLYIFGHSLGGAVAVELASSRDCAGLIVESSFTSAPDMARHIFRVPGTEYLARSRFDSASKIRRVRAPVLVIHGTRDEVIPLQMGRKLFEAAPEPKSFFEIVGAGHNDILAVGGERYLDQLKAFLAQARESGGKSVKSKG